MLASISIGMLLVGLTVAIHAYGSTLWLRHLALEYLDGRGHWRGGTKLWVLMSTAFVLLTLHTLEIFLWAATYLAVPGIEAVQTLEEAFYFSMVTFTTLGFGEITLGPPERLLSSIEAMNGILLFGLTTAMLFSVVQRQWKEIVESRPHKARDGGC